MIINGSDIATQIIEELKANDKSRKSVAFLLFNENPESRSFINRKMKVASQLGVTAELFELFNISTTQALEVIDDISGKFDGVVIQLPLPPQLDVEMLLNAIPWQKDVDVLSKIGILNFKTGTSQLVPPVAGAVQKILEKESINLAEKNIVILGKGRLVGEPVKEFFEKVGFSPRVFDKNDDQDNVIEALGNADIIITGIGVPHFLKPEMIKNGVILIDAGTSESEGVIMGDIDPLCALKSSLMTPVPGGVGPITVAVLFENLFKS